MNDTFYYSFKTGHHSGHGKGGHGKHSGKGKHNKSKTHIPSTASIVAAHNKKIQDKEHNRLNVVARKHATHPFRTHGQVEAFRKKRDNSAVQRHAQEVAKDNPMGMFPGSSGVDANANNTGSNYAHSATNINNNGHINSMTDIVGEVKSHSYLFMDAGLIGVASLLLLPKVGVKAIPPKFNKLAWTASLGALAVGVIGHMMNPSGRAFLGEHHGGFHPGRPGFHGHPGHFRVRPGFGRGHWVGGRWIAYPYLDPYLDPYLPVDPLLEYPYDPLIPYEGYPYGYYIGGRYFRGIRPGFEHFRGGEHGGFHGGHEHGGFGGHEHGGFPGGHHESGGEHGGFPGGGGHQEGSGSHSFPGGGGHEEAGGHPGGGAANLAYSFNAGRQSSNPEWDTSGAWFDESKYKPGKPRYDQHSALAFSYFSPAIFPEMSYFNQKATPPYTNASESAVAPSDVILPKEIDTSHYILGSRSPIDDFNHMPPTLLSDIY